VRSKRGRRVRSRALDEFRAPAGVDERRVHAPRELRAKKRSLRCRSRVRARGALAPYCPSLDEPTFAANVVGPLDPRPPAKFTTATRPGNSAEDAATEPNPPADCPARTTRVASAQGSGARLDGARMSRAVSRPAAYVVGIGAAAVRLGPVAADSPYPRRVGTTTANPMARKGRLCTAIRWRPSSRRACAERGLPCESTTIGKGPRASGRKTVTSIVSRWPFASTTGTRITVSVIRRNRDAAWAATARAPRRAGQHVQHLNKR
jgi:hypothetical protein